MTGQWDGLVTMTSIAAERSVNMTWPFTIGATRPGSVEAGLKEPVVVGFFTIMRSRNSNENLWYAPVSRHKLC